MGYYSSYKKMNSPRSADPDVLARIVALKEEHNISPNVTSFLSSLVQGYKKYGGITEKQYDAFYEIESSYLHKRAQEDDDGWDDQYDDLKREKAEVCALYYLANPPYYGDLAFRILNEPDFIPSKEQYESIIKNKYATKVLNSFYSEPRFKVNDYVSLRKTHPYGWEKESKLYVIVQVAPEPITTAAKGTKKYKILPIDNRNTYIAEERWLKSAKIHKKT